MMPNKNEFAEREQNVTLFGIWKVFQERKNTKFVQPINTTQNKDRVTKKAVNTSNEDEQWS